MNRISKLVIQKFGIIYYLKHYGQIKEMLNQYKKYEQALNELIKDDEVSTEFTN